MTPARRLLAACLLAAAPLAAASFPATGETVIPGADAPAFTQARDLWLAGTDDAAALAALAALARQGNTAAQLLLGTLDPLTPLHAAVTAPLDRKARIALLRDETRGLSGRNWRTIAAESLPLAAALDDLARVDMLETALPAALAAGELRAAIPAISTLVNLGHYEASLAYLLTPELRPYTGSLAQVALGALRSPGLPDELRLPPGGLARAEADLMALGWPGETDRALWWPLSSDAWDPQVPGPRLARSAWLAAAPPMAPHRALCERLCPDDPTLCLVSIDYAIGIASGPPFTTGLSPVETLIPTETYRASARFDGDLLAFARAGRASVQPDPPWFDACLAAATDAP